MAAAEDPARNLACLLKYGSITATDYCLCVAGVTDNFACSYDCSCDVLGLQCNASTCQLSKQMIGLLVFAVFASLVGVSSCVVLCCYLSRNRRRHTNYYIVQHTTELPIYEPHHHKHQHHAHLQHQPPFPRVILVTLG